MIPEDLMMMSFWSDAVAISMLPPMCNTLGKKICECVNSQMTNL